MADNWKEIQITNSPKTELKELEIDLSKDTDDEHEEQSGNSTRTNVQTNDRNSGRTQETKNDQNSTDGTKIDEGKDEDAEEGSQVNGGSRRSRTIRNLRARAQQLEAALRQSEFEKQALAQRTQAQSANYVKEQSEFYAKRVDELEADYEKAIAENNPKLQAQIARKLNDAQMNQKVYEAAEADIPDTQATQVQQPAQQVQAAQPRIPEAANRWVQKNQWFLKDQALNYKTREINNELILEGADPNTDEFYNELNSRLEEEGLNLNKLQGVAAQQPQGKQNQQGQRRSPVAGSGDAEGAEAPRTKTVKTAFKRVGDKIQVTPSAEDYDMAERLNRPIESYMKSKLLYEESGGIGYTPINITSR